MMVHRSSDNVVHASSYWSNVPFMVFVTRLSRGLAAKSHRLHVHVGHLGFRCSRSFDRVDGPTGPLSRKVALPEEVTRSIMDTIEFPSTGRTA